jgi:membrane protein DedA with SNARE-associated domain
MTHDLVLLLGQYGLAVVFANVLIEQLGLPVPAVPTLVVAGALATEGALSMPLLFAVALLACALADIVWYIAGRRYGNRVMKLLCRISLTPDYCVSETQVRFERWGVNALLIAKFVRAWRPSRRRLPARRASAGNGFCSSTPWAGPCGWARGSAAGYCSDRTWSGS